MANAILVRDKPGVISVFKLQGSPIFSLWETRANPSFSCADERPEERLRMLEYYLDVIRDSGTVADYTIKFHEEASKTGKITNNTPVFGSLTFKLNSPDMGLETSRGSANVSGTGVSLLNELFKEKLERLEDKYQRQIEDMQREHEDELDQMEEATSGKKKKLGALGQIGELGNEYPWMQEIIKEGIGMFKDMLVVGKHKMRQQPAGGGINGVDTAAMTYKDKIAQAQNTLMTWYTKQHGDTTVQENREKGANDFADDLLLLAGLTKDDDIMQLALKKLRSLA